MREAPGIFQRARRQHLARADLLTAAKYGVVFRSAIIYHGMFGSALFQTLYAARPWRGCSRFSAAWNFMCS